MNYQNYPVGFKQLCLKNNLTEITVTLVKKDLQKKTQSPNILQSKNLMNSLLFLMIQEHLKPLYVVGSVSCTGRLKCSK